MAKQAAGILVYRQTGGQAEVLLAHMGGPFHAKKDEGHWTIPKGEFDDGDNPKAAAAREFKEELGKEPPPGDWLDLGEVNYGGGPKKGKKVMAWAIEGDFDATNIQSNTFELEWPPRSGNIVQFPEIDRAAWFGLEAAPPKLIKAQVAFIERLASQLGQKMESPNKSEQQALL